MRTPVPRECRILLKLASPARDREAILADLQEEADARAARSGTVAARRWSRRQVITSLPPLLAQRFRGTVTDLRRAHMSAWRGLSSDLVLSGRRLVKAPGFALVCVLTLALGIGGNTAIFTLIDRVMLERLPVARPAELYRLGDTDDCCVNTGLPGSFSLFSYDLYLHLRDVSASQFTNLAAFQANVRTVTLGRPEGDAPPETLDSAFVSGNYFQTFEVTPAAGRLIQPADDRPGAPAVAVLSYRAWTDRFQQRADVIGRDVTLNGIPTTIVGVAPRAFYGETLRPNPAAIWVPLADEPVLQPAAKLLEARGSHWLYLIGRLRPGASIPALNAQLTTAVQQWVKTLDLSADDLKQVPRQHVTLTSAARGVRTFTGGFEPALRVLQAIAAAVLLIACANLANLLLARGLSQRGETAVRVALGAPRSRLIVQSLVESVGLACLGGAVGLWVSYVAAQSVVRLTFQGAASVPIDPRPSLPVLAFAFVVSLATGVVFGAAPAVIGSRSDPIDAMRGAGRTTGERGGRLRRSLIALQVALSLVLVTCAGLLGRSLHNLEAQDFGFRTDGRYVAVLAPSFATMPQEQLAPLYKRMRERLERLPGVVNVGYSLYSPMSGDNWSSLITVDGHDPKERLLASWNRVSPGYFETIGTPVIRGRAFTDQDGPETPLVALVTQRFATKFFGAQDPIGHHLGFANTKGTAARDIEIVGVVGDAKYHDGRDDPYPTFFLPFLQQSRVSGALGGAVRLDRSHYPVAIELQTTGAAQGLEGDIRRALAGVDHRLTIRTVLSLDDQIAQQFTLENLLARLSAAFGGIALLLACLGLYGVTAFTVSRRTREIGIRMAIGATRPRVVRNVLKGAMVQLAIGIAIGLPAALAAGRLLGAQLFAVGADDPLVLIGAAVVLTAAALIAALLPARRAARMDPVRALRVE